jgi:CO/xanthine dehydrogenase FAD-binding subunit
VLDAIIETVQGDGKTRAIPIAEFHRLPRDTPHIETVLVFPTANEECDTVDPKLTQIAAALTGCSANK